MNNRLLSLQCVCSKSWITTSPCELYTLHVGSGDSLNKAAHVLIPVILVDSQGHAMWEKNAYKLHGLRA